MDKIYNDLYEIQVLLDITNNKTLADIVNRDMANEIGTHIAQIATYRKKGLNGVADKLEELVGYQRALLNVTNDILSRHGD